MSQPSPCDCYCKSLEEDEEEDDEALQHRIYHIHVLLEECRNPTLCYAEDGKDGDGWIDNVSNTLETLVTIQRQLTGRCLIHGDGAATHDLYYLPKDDLNFGVHDIGLKDNLFNDEAAELATTLTTNTNSTAAESPSTVKPTTTKTIWAIGFQPVFPCLNAFCPSLFVSLSSLFGVDDFVCFHVLLAPLDPPP
eukprot:g25278.t1